MSTRTRGIIALAILIALAVVALVLSTAVPDDDQTVIFDVKMDADGKLAYIDMTGDYGFEDYLRHGSSDLDLTDFYEYLKDNVTCGRYINGVIPRNCSVFEATDADGSGYLVGRNFDYRYTMPAVVYTHADGCYRSMSLVDMRMFVDTDEDYRKLPADVRLNAAPYIPLDGVNEKGVFVCVNMVHNVSEMDMSGKTPIFTTCALRIILDHADSTEKAAELLQDYSLRAEGCYHLFVTDTSGDSRAIEVIDGRIKATPTELMTNHYIYPGTGVPISESSQQRYDIIRDALDASDVMDEDRVKDVLVSVKQDSSDLSHYTRWSIVYDTEDLTATLYLRTGQTMDYDHPIRLELEAA